jgi:hypothetical protein
MGNLPCKHVGHRYRARILATKESRLMYELRHTYALIKLGLLEEKPSTWERLRKMGPMLGATLGTGLGLALTKGRGGKALARGALGGLGGGATIGWLPDIMASGIEGVRGK